MNLKLANNATSALAADITNVDTSLTVAAGEGAKFPNPTSPEYFYMTLQQGTFIEIVKVTARVTDTFTVVRGQDGTVGVAFTTGAKVELRLNKAQLDEYATEKMLYEAANGISKYKNYIFNPNAVQDTLGWLPYADLAAAIPTDGIGGAPTIAWERNTTNPLNSIADFKLTKTGISQGEGVAYQCNIDVEDRNDFLGISFNTLVASGTYTNNDLQIFAYDVTNGALLNDGKIILNIEAGSSYIPHYASVFIPWNCAAIRFIVHVATASATAYAIQFSNFKLTDNPFEYVDVPKENVFSATMNGATISTTNVTGWMTAAMNGSYVDISLNSAYFATKPSFVVTKFANPYTISASWVPGTPNIIRVGQYDNDSANLLLTLSGVDFQIVVQRNGIDYHPPGTHVVTQAKSNASNDATYTPTITGFGTTTGVNFTWAQLGQYALISGTFTVGTPTAVEAQITLPIVGGVQITTPTTITTSARGFISIANSATVGLNEIIVLAESNKSYFVFAKQGPATKALGNQLMSVGTQATVWALIPISGWSAESQFLAAVPVQQVCYIKDVQPANTAPGTFTSGAWRTRTLNTINENGSNTSGTCSFASLSTNQFTLQPGTYRIRASAPAYSCQGHIVSLYNYTTSAYVCYGSSEWNSSAGSYAATRSTLATSITITSSTVFELRHLAEYSGAFGLAVQVNQETYAEMEIVKVK